MLIALWCFSTHTFKLSQVQPPAFTAFYNTFVSKVFWECPFVKSFWNEISNWMKKSSCFLNEEFSFLTCIGLVNDTTNLLFHHALLIARYHIYFSNQKGFNPSWELFFRTFLNCLDYERRYAIKTGTLRNFNAKWGAFIQENDL